MGHLFIGGAVTYEPKPPTLNDLYVGAPDFCYNYLLFGDEFRDKLDAEDFYDAVKTLHKTGTIADDSTVPTPGNEPPPYNHPVNQDSDSSESEYYPEPQDHTAPVRCRQCGAHGWLECNCTHCNGVYKPVNQADVSEYYVKKYPEDIGLGWSIGDFFDSLGGDKTDETGPEGVTEVVTEPKVKDYKEEETDMYLKFHYEC